jgi:hypothetical protein
MSGGHVYSNARVNSEVRRMSVVRRIRRVEFFGRTSGRTTDTYLRVNTATDSVRRMSVD